MRKYEELNSSVKAKRLVALDKSGKYPKEETTAAFRELEQIFIDTLLPSELLAIPENTIVVLDNFPVEKSALEQFNKAYPQSVELFIILHTQNTALLTERMIARNRSDSADPRLIRKRIETYSNVVIPNLQKMASLYDRRTKEIVVNVDKCASMYNTLESILDMVKMLKSQYTVQSDSLHTLIRMEDASLAMMELYVRKAASYNYPQAYLDTVSGQITDSAHGEISNTEFSTTAGNKYHLIRNPRYHKVQRYVLWPLPGNLDYRVDDKHEIDIYTTDASDYSRCLDASRTLPCSVVDLILCFDLASIRCWIDDMQDIQHQGRQYLSNELGLPTEDFDCFLHYPGASYYSVLHIHFTHGFDCDYDRVHHLSAVIIDLQHLIDKGGSEEVRRAVAGKYSSYTTSYEDIYSFYVCPLCKVVEFSSEHTCKSA